MFLEGLLSQWTGIACLDNEVRKKDDVSRFESAFRRP